MRKIGCLIVEIIFIFSISQPVLADEISELKKEMGEMQKKIEALERKDKGKLEDMSPEFPEVLEEKIQSMEEEILFLLERQDSFLNQLEEKIQFNLYGTLEFEGFENTNTSFDARNIELFATAYLTNRLSIGIEIEFERTAKTSAGSRQGEVEVEQGWLEYKINRQIRSRFGVILVPFGKFNGEHFQPFRDLTERPIVMRRVIPTAWAEPGAGFVGDIPLGKWLGSKGFMDMDMNYQFFVINGLTNAISDTSIRDARAAFGSDNNNNKALVGRLGISPFDNQEIGLSGYFGDYDGNDRDLSGFDIDWDFTFGELELIGEFAFFELQEGGLQQGSSTLTVPGSLSGGYIQANYHFWFDSLNETFLGEDFSNPTFTAVLRYGEARIQDDNDTGTGDNEEKRWTIGLNYRPVEEFVFKIEYQFNETDNESLERGNKNGFIASVSAAF